MTSTIDPHVTTEGDEQTTRRGPRRVNQRPGATKRRARRQFRQAVTLYKTSSGYAGLGGGRWNRVGVPPEYLASSVQLCGLWPFGAGSSRPSVGVPIGPDLDALSTVCCDPVAWFIAGFISNPSIMMFGLPGLGKSSIAARMILGCADRGIPPLIFGDLKPDYAELIDALGGVVIPVGPGLAQINPLDLGALVDAADRIGGEDGAALRRLAEGKAVELTLAIAQIVRRRPLEDFEETVLTEAVKLVRETIEQPTLHDVLSLLDTAHPELMVLTLSADAAEFRKTMTPLHRTMLAMLRGPMGQVFGGKTSIPIPVDNPGGVCIDISGLREGDQQLLAAVMMATWAHGFAAVDAQWELSQHGLATWNGFLTVQDELWKPLRASSGLVDRLDALSRTNRAQGVGEIRITHSLKDADSLATEEDRNKARGFAERAGMIGVLGLDRSDLRKLSENVTLSSKEINRVASWRTPKSWKSGQRDRDGRPMAPPGAGKVLLKVGGRAGIPVQFDITDRERDLHDTNARWGTRNNPEEVLS